MKPLALRPREGRLGPDGPLGFVLAALLAAATVAVNVCRFVGWYTCTADVAVRVVVVAWAGTATLTGKVTVVPDGTAVTVMVSSAVT